MMLLPGTQKKTSPAGVAKIRGFEGCELVAYKCPAGKWTIGVGHTGASVTQGLVITQERADQYLASDLLTFEDLVNRVVLVPLTQGQFDACVSFAFNVGPGHPCDKDGTGGKDGFQWLKARDANGYPRYSTLLRDLNAGDYAGCADQFLEWALPKRRAAERAMFLG